MWEDSTASLLPLSVILPLLTWKTIGLEPFCWGGNLAASRSDACWLWVPGKVWSLVVMLPTCDTTTCTPTASTIQTSRMRSGCAAQ